MDPGAIAKLLIRCMRCIVKPVGKTGRRLPIFTSQRVQRLYKIPVSCARQIMLHSTFRAYYYRSDSRASLKAPLSDRRYANAVSRIFIDRAPASREKESRAKKSHDRISERSNIRTARYTAFKSAFIACVSERASINGCRGTAVIKPLTLLYRVINLNITTHVSRVSALLIYRSRGFHDVTERRRRRRETVCSSGEDDPPTNLSFLGIFFFYLTDQEYFVIFSLFIENKGRNLPRIGYFIFVFSFIREIFLFLSRSNFDKVFERSDE